MSKMKDVYLLIEDAKTEGQKPGKPLTCREASIHSVMMYIACGQPATRFILSERGAKVYPMCPGCASHNVKNRGAVDVGEVQ